MTRLYEVNPANTAEIWGESADVPPKRYQVGALRVTLHNGRVFERINGPVPEGDLYEAIEDNTPAPPYHVLDRVDLVFEGAVNNPAARVRETRVYVQISIDDLYTAKQQELRNQDQAARYQTFDTDLAQNWWVVCTQNARNEIYEVAINWNLRQHKGQAWPGGINAPRIGILNANTGQVRREQVTSAPPFEQLVQEMALHGQDCGLATHDCGEAMESAHGSNDWAALAAIDPSDGSWGYPPYQDLSEQALTQFNGG